MIDTHTAMDATDFASHKPANQVPDLNPLGRRLFDHFRKAIPMIAIAWLTLGSVSHADDWSEADGLFKQALAATPGEPHTESLFTQSALKFEAAANDRKRPGAAWFNAGNAWFNAGEIGRSIACYRQARIYRPFDETISNSLNAARALSVDVVEDKRGLQLDVIPVRWLSSALVVGVWALVVFLLIHRRFKTNGTLTGVIAMLMLLILVGSLTAFASNRSRKKSLAATWGAH